MSNVIAVIYESLFFAFLTVFKNNKKLLDRSETNGFLIARTEFTDHFLFKPEAK